MPSVNRITSYSQVVRSVYSGDGNTPTKYENGAVLETAYTYWTAEGGIIIQFGDKICAAPPAQGARQMDSTTKVAGGASEFELSADHTVDHDTARLAPLNIPIGPNAHLNRFRNIFLYNAK